MQVPAPFQEAYRIQRPVTMSVDLVSRPYTLALELCSDSNSWAVLHFYLLLGFQIVHDVHI